MAPRVIDEAIEDGAGVAPPTEHDMSVDGARAQDNRPRGMGEVLRAQSSSTDPVFRPITTRRYREDHQLRGEIQRTSSAFRPLPRRANNPEERLSQSRRARAGNRQVLDLGNGNIRVTIPGAGGRYARSGNTPNLGYFRQYNGNDIAAWRARQEAYPVPLVLPLREPGEHPHIILGDLVRMTRFMANYWTALADDMSAEDDQWWME